MIINTTPSWHHSRNNSEWEKIRWLNHKQITHTSHAINFPFSFLAFSRKKYYVQYLKKKSFLFTAERVCVRERERKVINITQFFLYNNKWKFVEPCEAAVKNWGRNNLQVLPFYFSREVKNFSLPLFIYREMPYRGKERKKSLN